jgi:glycerol-3-phosphate dehydrogenase
MGEEIVDFALATWKRDHAQGKLKSPVSKHSRSKTKTPVNPMATPAMMARTFGKVRERELVERYGAEALDIVERAKELGPSQLADPDGFPELLTQLRHVMRTEMVMHLEDFYIRRVPLYLARADHGLPWAEALARIWAEERKLTEGDAARELEQLKAELAKRSSWKKGLIK